MTALWRTPECRLSQAAAAALALLLLLTTLAGPAVQAQATPAALPGAPQNLSATAGSKRVVLRWEAPADNGSSAIVRYETRYAEGNSVPEDARWYELRTDTEIEYVPLTNGTLYSFELRAVNGQGAGPAVQVQATPATVPDAPQNLSATAGDSQVALQWEAPADDGGADLVRYELRHAAAASIPSGTAWTPMGLETAHTVTGLTNDARYSFELRAVNARGASRIVKVRAKPVSPDAPQNLTAAAEDSQIVLRWAAPADDGGADLVRYELRHAVGASVPSDTAWTPVGLVTTHTVTGLANGTLYSFELRAVKGQGAGPAVQVRAKPFALPSVPQNLSATARNKQVSLRWEEPAATGGSAIVRYEARYAEGDSVPEDARWYKLGTYTKILFPALTNGTLYTFDLRAVNARGAGPAVRVQATPATVPDAPQNLSAAPENLGVVLRWEAPTDDGGSEIERYEVRYVEGDSVPEDVEWRGIGSLTGTGLGLLTNGTLHTFEVRAVNARGAGPAARVQMTPATVPDAPQSLSATAGDSQVGLQWEAPADDGGADLVRYEVRHAAAASVPADTAWTPVGLVTGHTMTGLANGALHSFELRAVNGQGAGPAVQAQTTPGKPAAPVPVPVTAPDAPQNLSATAGDSQVALQWEAPADIGGSDLVRYEVRHAAAASVPADTAWTPVGLETTHTVTGLANGALHSFELRAVNGQGASPALQAQATPATVPDAPQNLSATAGDSQVALQWEAPADVGGSDLVRYELRHAAADSVPADTAWTPVGLETTHTVTGLANGALHSFELRAVNGQGAGPVTKVQATPATVPDAPQNLSATAGDSQVALQWEAPADDGGSDLVRYEVRHAAADSVPADTAWTPVGLVTGHTLTGLANGALHSFELRAVNGQGAGPVTKVQATPATVPDAPQNLSATAGDSQVALQWETPADVGGSDLVRYELRHAAADSVPADTAWTPVGLETTHTVTGLANGALHSFELRAVNGQGAGPVTKVQATPATVPDAPQNLSATAGDSQVALQWETPADVGGSDLVRYELRHAAADSVPADTAWTPVGLETTHTVSAVPTWCATSCAMPRPTAFLRIRRGPRWASSRPTP